MVDRTHTAIAEAGLLIVDKDAGMTSHDVVSKCRKLLHTRKIGHAGTLDPMATGVLVLGVERATKMLGMLSLTTKAYSASIRLGQFSNTDDAEGELSDALDAQHLDDEQIAGEVDVLTGEIEQIPATISAIKIDGRRAYTLARSGAEVQLQSRQVTVGRFDVLARRDVGDSGAVDLDVEVECSSGTYIRALARDLGAALGVGGHLTALRRTRVGPFTLTHARTLEQLAEHPQVSLDIDEAAQTAFPQRQIDDAEAESLSQGRWLEPIGCKDVYAAVDPSGHTIALVQERGRRAGSVMVVRPANMRL